VRGTLILPYGIGDSAIVVAPAPMAHRFRPSATTIKESHMPEKSPQKPAGKKPGKSLKEKREAKKDKKENRSGLGR
jgi:hypothetical protein